MKTNEILAQATHEEVWTLLPWYINQTLSDDEHNYVKQHLASCVSCRSELAVQQRLMNNVCVSTTEEVCEHTQYSQLLKKIQIDKPATGKSQASFFSTSFLPKINMQNMARAAAVLLVVSLPFAVSFESTDVDFKTLSNAPIDREGEAYDIRVIFEDTINDRQRQALLTLVDAEIIHHADSQGVYVIRLSNPARFTTASSEDKTRDASMAIDLLRQYPGIIFAEPFVSSGT